MSLSTFAKTLKIASASTTASAKCLQMRVLSADASVFAHLCPVVFTGHQFDYMCTYSNLDRFQGTLHVLGAFGSKKVLSNLTAQKQLRFCCHTVLTFSYFYSVKWRHFFRQCCWAWLLLLKVLSYLMHSWSTVCSQVPMYHIPGLPKLKMPYGLKS